MTEQPTTRIAGWLADTAPAVCALSGVALRLVLVVLVVVPSLVVSGPPGG